MSANASLGSCRLLAALATAAALGVGLATPSAAQPDRQILPLGTGFQYTFDDFTQTVTPTSIRLTDTINGWGGAGGGFAPLDLSAYANGRWVVDFQENPANRVDLFGLELYDAAGNSGTWQISASGGAPGVPQQVTTLGTLRQPDFGQNDFQHLDLAHITNFQILGQWQSPEPVDLTFTSVKLSNTAPPPPPYAGYEPDAAWRAEANARIDQVRKADLSVRVIDATGAPVPARVGVLQTRHDFGFGSAVVAYGLRDNNPQYDQYKAKVEELFNVATIENNLKWPAWEGEWGSNWTKPGAQAALDWLNDRGIRTRGHVLVWPGIENLPSDLRALLGSGPLSTAQQQQLRDRVLSHIADVAGATSGKLDFWDVVNEPRANHDIMDALPEGDAVMATWFQAARAAAPDAKLFLNEYNILASGGATDTASQRLLESQVRALQAAGAPIGGVGLQAHFSDSSLTGPEQLWTILDRYEALGVDIQATEFTYATTDEQLQAAYTRDFYTALFAHEAVTDILAWGFWEGALYEPLAAMYRNDWSIKPNGQALLDLVFHQWWTDAQLEAGAADGVASLRAFRGTHDVSADFGSHHASQTGVSLGADGAAVTITLDLVLGDYNSDGTVDAADYTVWRDTLGRSVPNPGDGADGDGDGVVGPGDLEVWRARFGASRVGGAPVPEPISAASAAAAAVLATRIRPRR